MAQLTHTMTPATIRSPPPQRATMGGAFRERRAKADISLMGATPTTIASAEAPAKRTATLITIRTILHNNGRITLYDSLIFTTCPKWTRETAYTVAPVANERATKYATTMATIPITNTAPDVRKSS